MPAGLAANGIGLGRIMRPSGRAHLSRKLTVIAFALTQRQQAHLEASPLACPNKSDSAVSGYRVRAEVGRCVLVAL